MAYLLVGVLGFAVGYVADSLAPRRLPLVRPSLWAISFGLILYALAMASIDTARFRLPEWAVLAGWVLLPASSLMLVYSLFVELPLARSYARADKPFRLVTSGTYALVRHPTVLWYILVLFALLLLSRSWLLLIAAPVWVALDILWALVQERFSLSGARAEYSDYRQRTPFLIPTRRSMKDFLGRSSAPGDSRVHQ